MTSDLRNMENKMNELDTIDAFETAIVSDDMMLVGKTALALRRRAYELDADGQYGRAEQFHSRASELAKRVRYLCRTK